MEFNNVWEDIRRADSYSRLGFPGTYYLAYRDLPQIISSHILGRNAVDFGCGTGRSTRFLEKHSFKTAGIDISEEMIKKAVELDPAGEYHLIKNNNFSRLEQNAYDLVLSAFTFDNIPGWEEKIELFNKLGNLLNSGGRIINLVSSPEIYLYEWASFTTNDFPENKKAKCGDKVRIIMKDVEDKRPVEDIFWPEKDYLDVYKKAGLDSVKTYKPLGKEEEELYQWVNETGIAPWTIYVLKKSI